tara:strand:+ start:249 stop:1133 length:885 start_codon:yes stop_codon:yes gene_type:complete
MRNNFFKGMINKKIAITGHTGIIGTNFINKFKKNTFIKCNIDITHRLKVFKWIKDNEFDAFIHLAAIVPVQKVQGNKKRALKINFNGTKNIIDAINFYKNKNVWFFYSSTSHVYGVRKSLRPFSENDKLSPHNYYGKTKLLSEKYIKNKSKKIITFCIGRIFSFTDIKQDKSFFIPNTFRKILNTKQLDINLSNYNGLRDFISVDEITSLIGMLYMQKSKGVFNIASGKPASLKNIVLKIHKITKSKKIKLNNIINNDNNIIANITKIKKKINWKPNSDINKILKKFYLQKYLR